MSRISDLVEAEAAEAEADEETPENEIADEETAEAEQPAQPAPVDVEKAVKQIEKENVRHAAAVERIMGADFALVHVCPACQDFAAGFTMTPPDETPPLLRGEEFAGCEKCNGYGQVLTGSLAEHGAMTTCRRCNGQGYVEVPLTPDYQAAPQQVADPNFELANQLRAQGFMVIEPQRPAPAPVV